MILTLYYHSNTGDKIIVNVELVTCNMDNVDLKV